MHLADPFYGVANPVCTDGGRVVKNGVGDYSFFPEFAIVHPSHSIVLVTFFGDTVGGSVNAFISNVNSFQKDIKIRQGAAGTLVDIHTDIAFLEYD